MTIAATRKRIVNAIASIDNEERQLARFLASLRLTPGHRILDVGCGFGNKLRFVAAQGYTVEGVDINPELVRHNREAGLACMTVDELEKSDGCYDVILMLHVVEHFLPAELLAFMDRHLDRLKPGGHLIIATPLQSPSFWQDFDHVKPYHPIGFKMVFGTGAQVQYYARNRLELVDLWFRRGVRVLEHFPGLYVANRSRLPVVINLLSALLFRASFGLIGRTDGWMGLFRKIEAMDGEG